MQSEISSLSRARGRITMRLNSASPRSLQLSWQPTSGSVKSTTATALNDPDSSQQKVLISLREGKEVKGVEQLEELRLFTQC